MNDENLQEKINLIGINKTQRHIFLCADPTKAKCCDGQASLEVWLYLKKRLDQLGLSRQGGILRTKANCLQVCTKGPIVVVYPEGVWYHSVNIEVMERIINEHLVQGKIVEEFCFYPTNSQAKTIPL